MCPAAAPASPQRWLRRFSRGLTLQTCGLHARMRVPCHAEVRRHCLIKGAALSFFHSHHGGRFCFRAIHLPAAAKSPTTTGSTWRPTRKRQGPCRARYAGRCSLAAGASSALRGRLPRRRLVHRVLAELPDVFLGLLRITALHLRQAIFHLRLLVGVAAIAARARALV